MPTGSNNDLKAFMCAQKLALCLGAARPSAYHAALSLINPAFAA
ncbi:MAG: hypothetical protein ACOX2Q_11425 [Dehalobacterium sp.]